MIWASSVHDGCPPERAVMSCFAGCGSTWEDCDTFGRSKTLPIRGHCLWPAAMGWSRVGARLQNADVGEAGHEHICHLNKAHFCGASAIFQRRIPIIPLPSRTLASPLAGRPGAAPAAAPCDPPSPRLRSAVTCPTAAAHQRGCRLPRGTQARPAGLVRTGSSVCLLAVRCLLPIGALRTRTRMRRSVWRAGHCSEAQIW